MAGRSKYTHTASTELVASFLRLAIDGNYSFSLSVDKNEEDEAGIPNEWGTGFVLWISKGSRSIGISAGDLTESDLLKMEEFFRRFFELALPLARVRDRIVRDTDPDERDYYRRYRQIPLLFEREGAVGEYGEGVRGGRRLLLRRPGSKRLLISDPPSEAGDDSCSAFE